MLHRVFAYLLKKNFDADWYEEILRKKKIEACLAGVTLREDSSRFYAEAQVFNLQKNKARIRIGTHTHIRGELLIFPYGGEIAVGSYCYIGEYSRIWSASKVTIGDHVLVSHNVNIMDTNSHELDFAERARGFGELIRSGHPETKPNVAAAPVQIEDHAWINFNSVILKGVRIGKGAIIGPNTVVLEDVPDFCLFAGNPGKVIKKL